MPNTAAEENKSEPKKGPTQGPITNLYTSKIIDKDAFLAAVAKQFPIRTQTPNTYVPDLAGRNINSSLYLGATPSRDRSEHQKEIFNKVFSVNDRGDGVAYIPVSDENWHYWRDIMRFGAWTQMLTAEENTRVQTEGIVYYRQGVSGQSLIFCQREVIPYALTILKKYQIVLDPGHFLHISPTDQNFIRYTPDDKSRERDIVVETTITKYLRKFHPSLTDVQLQEIAEIHKVQCGDGGISFFTSADDIRRVYQNGPGSCMSHGEAHYKSPTHPTAAYAEAPGVRLAAIEAGDGTYNARCLIYDNPDNPKDKRLIRLYGDSILHTKLKKQGYTDGTWEGVKLRKVSFLDKYGKPLPNTFVLPYIDDATNGNGRSFSVQYAFTAPELDYILITTRDNAAALVKKNPTGISVLATTTNGAWGTHLNYNAMRHNSYEARSGVQASKYRPPTATKKNEWDELYCSVCNEVYDAEYFKPLLMGDRIKSAEMPTKLSVCTRCIANSSQYGLIPAPNVEREIYIFIDNLFAKHKTSGDICSANLVWKKSNAEKYDFVYEFQLKDFGYAVLEPSVYGNNQFVKVETTTLVDEQVFRTDDIVEDVYGKKNTKLHTFFLGQTADGKMQYFPNDPSTIRTAMQAGKFYIVDDKLEYRDKQAFNPASRKEYFKAIGELEEEEDGTRTSFEQTISFDSALPLIDALNVMSSALMVMYSFQFNSITLSEICMQNLCRIFPRVNQTLINTLCVAYRNDVCIDKFAGIEGIQCISPQLTAAFLQGNLLHGDTEIDENTREVFLTDQGLRRFVSQAVPIFSSGTSTLFVKRRDAAKPTSIPPTTTNKKKRTPLLFETNYSSTTIV